MSALPTYSVRKTIDGSGYTGYATALGFMAYTISLLVKSSKASARSVFVDVSNQTG